MNENINLINILKNAKLGIALYTSVFGNICFNGIVKLKGEYIIRIAIPMEGFHVVKEYQYFDSLGRYCDPLYNNTFFVLYNNRECVIFPSEECRDWNKFKLK